MRKLLLATAAVVGASMGTMGIATAAPPFTDQGNVATPASMGAFTYGDNNYMGGTMTKGLEVNPTPGTMVIRLGVKMLVSAGTNWSNLDKYSGPGPVGSGSTVAGARKLYPQQISEYVWFFPGMDAMASNGLRYGAAAEIRQNFPAAAQAELLTNGGTVNTSSQTLFVRRAFGYLAGSFGIVRVGEFDGLIGTYDEGGMTTGVFLSPSGTIVGGNLESAYPGNGSMLPYFAAQTGNEYGNAKIVYLSPSFNGFDFGLQYAPNPFNGNQSQPIDGSCASAAGIGCPNVGSNSAFGSGSVSMNEYSVGVRYQHAVGPAAVLAYAVYFGSGHTDYTGGAAAAEAVTGNPHFTGQFDNISLGMFGANVTVAGVSVFGNVMYGAYNGILATKPQGAPDAIGFGTGLKYSFGPYSVGAVYSQYDSQGAFNLVGISQRHEWAFEAAATYSPAPGLVLFTDYNYSGRHQSDYNFATGEVGSAYNNVNSQGVQVGMMVKW